MILVLVLSLARFPQAWAAEAYSLDDCFRLALERSETLAMQEESINQAEARVLQTRAAFLPTLGFAYTFAKQEAPGSGLARSFFPAEQTTAKAAASQSLFRGFRDFAALKQRRLERGASESARDQARLRLFEDTASAFYDVLAYEQDLLNYRSEIDASEERRRELSDLRRLARAREADIVAIESSIAGLEAEAAASRGLLDAARETLAFLTGRPPESSLRDGDPFPEFLEPLENWMASLERRPDVELSRRRAEAAAQELRAAKGGHLPSADLGFNYYFQRPGVNSDVRWDVQLGLSVAILSGGLTRAQVSEAASRRREKERALEQSRRQAQREIRGLYKGVAAALEQARKLEKVTELSSRGYTLRLLDSRQGLAAHVDVLQALAAAYQARRGYQHARFAVKQQHARLEAACARRGLQ